jgi:hypothetical protein
MLPAIDGSRINVPSAGRYRVRPLPERRGKLRTDGN